MVDEYLTRILIHALHVEGGAWLRSHDIALSMTTWPNLAAPEAAKSSPGQNGLTTIRKMMIATTAASVPSASLALLLLSAAERAGVTSPSACASTTARSSVLPVGRNTVGPSAVMPMNRTSEARTQLVWEPC